VNHEVVAQLVEEITTRAGLTVNAKLDKRQHPAHMKVIGCRDSFCEAWVVCIAWRGTYTI
jgi:hypothetical protein